MDATTMSQVGLGGGVISILSIAFAIFKYINHRTIRSKCCGVQGEVGIDVDTPKETKVEVKPVEVTPV
jgi:hypothetical protein